MNIVELNKKEINTVCGGSVGSIVTWPFYYFYNKAASACSYVWNNKIETLLSLGTTALFIAAGCYLNRSLGGGEEKPLKETTSTIQKNFFGRTKKDG